MTGLNREQLREMARAAVADWPPLTEAQRLQLAVTLRPDLPDPDWSHAVDPPPRAPDKAA